MDVNGFRNNGTYRSVHIGPDVPSPIIVILATAWRLARAGAQTEFGPGITERYLEALVERYGKTGHTEVLSPVQVIGIIKIWDYIKDNSSIGSLLGTNDLNLVRTFLAQAKATGCYDLS